MVQSFQFPIVLDSDCIIILGRAGLLNRIPPDASTIVIPKKVNEELRKYRRRNPRSIVLRWLDAHQHLVKGFQTTEENQVYYSLLSDPGNGLGEGEIAAIAIAAQRKGTLASNDVLARRTAAAMGIPLLHSTELAERLSPRLGFSDS